MDMDEELKNLKEKLEATEKEREEYLNGWKRAKADFINYQREENNRMFSAISLINGGLALEIIRVLDGWDMARKESPKESEGFLLIRKQLEDVLKKIKVEKIKISPGDKFDSKIHESIGEIESDQPPGTVAEVMLSGYFLGEHALRPVQVKLSKSK